MVGCVYIFGDISDLCFEWNNWYILFKDDKIVGIKVKGVRFMYGLY